MFLLRLTLKYFAWPADNKTAGVSPAGCYYVSASDGGGFHCFNSMLVFSRCVFVANTASGHGGGMYCQDSDPMLTHVTFCANDAGQGGGLYLLGSSPAMNNTLNQNRRYW